MPVKMWYKLKIGTWNVRYTSLMPVKKDYPYCDDKGNILTKVTGKIEKGYFLDNEGNKHFNSFRLINNKPYAKLQKTKEIQKGKYRELDLKEYEDLVIEKEYLVFCEDLHEELITTEKCLKFGFTNGNGFKVYRAYIYPSKLYKGFLFMILGTTQKSEIISSKIQEIKQQDKAKEIDLTIQGINRASVDDLIQI